MQRAGYWIGLVLTLVVALPTLAADKNTPQGEGIEASTLGTWTSPVAGRLVSVPQVGTTFTLRYEYLTVEAVPNVAAPNRPRGQNGQNQAARNQLQRLQQQQNRIAQLQRELQNAKPRDQARLARDLQNEVSRYQNDANRYRQNTAQLPPAQVPLVRYVPLHIDVLFETDDDLKVRTAYVPTPEGTDDKGNPRTFKQDEIDKLKDPKYPGTYASTLDHLKKGQAVQIYLVKRKIIGGDDKPSASDKSTDTGTAKSSTPPTTTNSPGAKLELPPTTVKGTDAPANKGTNTPTVKGTDTPTIKGPDTPTVKSTDKSTDKGTDTPTDKGMDKSTDKSMDKPVDKPKYKQVVSLILIVADVPDTTTNEKNN